MTSPHGAPPASVTRMEALALAKAIGTLAG
jgi:hypothetical protein